MPYKVTNDRLIVLNQHGKPIYGFKVKDPMEGFNTGNIKPYQRPNFFSITQSEYQGYYE